MTRRCPPLPRLLSLAVASAALPALAQDAPALPLWEIGAVGLTVAQQAYPGASVRVNRGLALPYLIYRGEFLRADRGGAGIRAVRTPTFEVDIGAAGSFGFRSDEIAVRRGMPNIGTLVEFGPRLKWHLGPATNEGRWRAELPLRGVFDLSRQLAHQGMAFEPELIFERSAQGGWSYSTSIGAVLGDRRLAETFYGVAPAHALAGRPAYVAEGGLITWRLSASFSRQLSPDWRLFGFARADSVAGGANESSPLVQQRTGTSVGMGITYSWKQSERPAAD